MHTVTTTDPKHLCTLQIKWNNQWNDYGLIFLLKWGVMLPVEINWSTFDECIYGSWRVVFTWAEYWHPKHMYDETLVYSNRTVFTYCNYLCPWKGKLEQLILVWSWGTAVAQWLRCCARNRKVAGLILAGVIGIFHWHKILPIALWPWGRLNL